MNDIQIKKADKFLIENGITYIFKNNIKSSKKNKYEKYLKRTHINYFISAAFIWSKTKQGMRFWQDIEKQWINELNIIT